MWQHSARWGRIACVAAGVTSAELCPSPVLADQPFPNALPRSTRPHHQQSAADPAPATPRAGVQVNGFVQTGFRSRLLENARDEHELVLLRGRLGANTELPPSPIEGLRVSPWVVLDVGTRGIILWDLAARLEYHATWLRVGVFRPLFGYENPTAVWQIPFSRRSILSTRLLSATGEVGDLGAELAHDFKLGDGVRLTPLVGYFEGSARQQDTDRDKDVRGRLELAVKGESGRPSYSLGVSAGTFAFAPEGEPLKKSVRAAADVHLVLGRHTFTVEGALVRYSEPVVYTEYGAYTMFETQPIEHIGVIGRYAAIAASDDDVRGAARAGGGLALYAYPDHPNDLKLTFEYERDIVPGEDVQLFALLQARFF